VTTPVAETVATAVALDVQLTTRPVSTLPLASFKVTVSDCEPPAMIVAVLGVTTTEATGTGVTVIVAVPDAVPLVAVIVVVPGATAVTTPVADTVATPGVVELHVTVRPVRTLPSLSLSVAVSVVVVPATKLALLGVTVTVATGTGVTVMAATALFPSLVAVMFAEPEATAFTSPDDDTVATDEWSVVQVIVRPVSTLPFASLSVATSVID